MPPEKIINKDFLRKVFTEEKNLFHLDEVKYVNMPKYDELSVRKFYSMLMQDETFAKYLPDPTPDSRLPDRKYLWDIANTV